MQHRKVLSISTSTVVVALLCCLPLLSAAPPPATVDAGGDGEWRCAPGCLCSRDGLTAKCDGDAPEPGELWACAPGCRCSRDGQFAECEGVTPRLATLPAGLASLTLRAHQLRQVTNDTFRPLPGLQQLDLFNGRISEVTADAFSTLPLLRSLSLSNNELTFLPADAFSGNTVLQALDLSSNPLVLPSIGPFLRSSSLRELSLAECSLRRFTPDAFTRLPALLSLDMSFNSFSQLTPEAVRPFGNLSWLSVDAGALSDDALAFLQDNGVEIDVFESVNTTADLLPEEDQDDTGGAIYLGFVDKEYHYDEDGTGVDYAVLKMDAASDAEPQWDGGRPRTGASESEVATGWMEPLSWQQVLYSTLLGSITCVTAALALWAVVLVIRRRSAARAAQVPRDTLDRAFRQVAGLPAYQQLQRQSAKPPSSGQGYRRLYDEEDAPAPASLPPRAAQPERCSCLSCSEPVPTQPCIRFYEGPASVHGAVPSRYYSLYPTQNK